MTQEQLAAVTGQNGSYISRIENGKEKNPGLSAYTRIADALKVDVGEILTSRGEQESTRETPKVGAIKGDAQLEGRLLAALDSDFPVEPTWRGDVLQAIAALSRALRRDYPSTS